MPVSILQWRAEIGIFNAKLAKYLFRSKYRVNVCPRNLSKFYTIPCMFLLLLKCVGDIELNPGPKKNNTSYTFSFCHWDLNNIAAHNFSKLSLLQCRAQIRHDLPPETFLDSSIPTNDERLNMKGYKLIKADNPSDSKKGGVGNYQKEFLAVRPVEVKNLYECLISEVPIKTKEDMWSHSKDCLVKLKMSLTFFS